MRPQVDTPRGHVTPGALMAQHRAPRNWIPRKGAFGVLHPKIEDAKGAGSSKFLVRLRRVFAEGELTIAVEDLRAAKNNSTADRGGRLKLTSGLVEPHHRIAPSLLTIFPKTTTALDAGIRGYALSCALAADIPDAAGSVGVLLSVRPLKSDL